MSFADVTIILDRSASMHSIRRPTVDGINKFIRDVLDIPGEGCWTLVLFDDPASAQGAKELFPHVVFSQKSNEEVPLLEEADFLTRGGTALVDAVCKTLHFTKERISKLSPEGQKERRVMIVIVTDGKENSSHEFSTSDMRGLIAQCQSESRWEFQFLAANQDAFATAGKYNLSHSTNYPGLQGVLTSGCVASGQLTYGSGGGYSYVNYADNSSVLQFESKTAGVYQALASGGMGVRAWKADGNEEALKLLTPIDPDAHLAYAASLQESKTSG